MGTILTLLLLIVGFILLIKGADIFVDGASNLAGHLKVSKMLIGLTIVAFGTSAPEFAVSVQSIVSGNGDIVLGNVIGSNILNILLILGCAAMVHALGVKHQTIRKEIPLTIFMTLIFAVLMSDSLFTEGMTNAFTRGDGIVLVLAFCVFIYYLIRMSRNKTTEDEATDLISIPRAITYTVLGIGGIVLGSNLVVNSASEIARMVGITERLISLTVIALGTSLPELVTSVTATKKGEYDLAIGNVIGSNIFNIGMVIGIPTAIFGGISQIAFSYIDLGVMILAVLLLFFMTFRDRSISRKQGLILLLVFVVYYSYVIIGG